MRDFFSPAYRTVSGRLHCECALMRRYRQYAVPAGQLTAQLQIYADRSLPVSLVGMLNAAVSFGFHIALSLLIYRKGLKNAHVGTRKTMSDNGATCCDYFHVQHPENGTSYLNLIGGYAKCDGTK